MNPASATVPTKPVLPIACASAGIVMASISLLGWLLGIDRLTSVFPG
jgi:hypothetical protein